MLKFAVFFFLCAPIVIECQSPAPVGGQSDASQMNLVHKDYEELAFNDIELVSGICNNLMDYISKAIEIANRDQIHIPDVELMLFQSSFHACGAHKDIYKYYLAGITMGANDSANPQMQQQQQAPAMMINN